MTTKYALLVRGGWVGHDPVATTDRYAKFLSGESFEVSTSDSLDVYLGDLSGVDLIVQCWTMGQITSEQLAGLRAAVAAGTGFAGWHGGIVDSYRNSADYLQLVGGQFVAHPGLPAEERTGEQPDNYRPHSIDLTAAGRADPIMAGVDDFVIDSEQYWVLADNYMEVLATTTQPVRPWDPWHEPITSPAVWKRRWGQGRIFVSTPGHRLEILMQPPVRTITERGLLWAART